MFGELVHVTTADGVRLDGWSIPAASRGGVPARTALLVHGLTGNFYGSRLLHFLAAQLVASGISALVVNTRGHDVLAVLSKHGQATSGGAAFERVSDAVWDLEAWQAWAHRRSGGPVTLLGHSLGAIKSLFAMSELKETAIDQVIALSATRLNHDSLLASPRGSRFRELLDEARERVDAGAGESLLKVDFPFPTWMAAAAYLEKYGPENRYDWFGFVDRIQVPSLLIWGERELADNPAFTGLTSLLPQHLDPLPEIDWAVIPGADHFYTGARPQAWQTIRDWMQLATEP